MTLQMNNLSRLINKYSHRFGAQDLLVLDLKKEMSLLQSKQEGLIFSRQFSIQSDRAGKAKKLS